MEGDPVGDTLALGEKELLAEENDEGVRVRHWLVVKVGAALGLAEPEGDTESVVEAQ